MKTRVSVLEEESKLALRNLLPLEWVYREKIPKYGIDAEIEIVEEGKITNKVFWLQIKVLESKISDRQIFSCQMKTDHMKYFEDCHLPVVILCWVKSENCFYLYLLRSI
jgi:hypothetical protein